MFTYLSVFQRKNTAIMSHYLKLLLAVVAFAIVHSEAADINTVVSTISKEKTKTLIFAFFSHRTDHSLSIGTTIGF